MPDLYAALNVPRDADRATIRRAYRKRAMKAHPDQGGSREQFALVKLAHDTLTDDNRRARYDQTGEAEEKPVDNRRGSILELIFTCLDLALSKLYERSKPPIHCDMVKLTKEAMREDEIRAKAQLRDQTDALKLTQSKLPGANAGRAQQASGIRTTIDKSMEVIRKNKLLKRKDKVVIVAGRPHMKKEHMSLVKVEEIN